MQQEYMKENRNESVRAVLIYLLESYQSTRLVGEGSNYMIVEGIAGLTPKTRRARIIGSKSVLVSQEDILLCVWACKQ